MNNKIIIISVVVVAIVGAYFVMMQTENKDTNEVIDAVPMTEDTIANSNIKTFELVVKNKRLVSGESKINVVQRDQILIKITSDEKDELHVHGYDESVELEKDIQSTLTFTANKTGRFPFELENSGVEIGVFEVQPK